MGGREHTMSRVIMTIARQIIYNKKQLTILLRQDTQTDRAHRHANPKRKWTRRVFIQGSQLEER